MKTTLFLLILQASQFRRFMARAARIGILSVLAMLAVGTLWAPPSGRKPPELVINREHPLIILYGPGTAERIVQGWQNLPADIRPYCVITMDPTALHVEARLEGWRRMLRGVQEHGVPIALQVAGPDESWTTPLWVVETLLKEFPCIKVVQIVEMRCAYYLKFGGDLDLAVPPNLRYIAEVLKLCGRYGKHLSLQIQADMVHLGSDHLAGPLRNLFREYREYFLPQNECIGPMYYSAQTAALGLWLAEYAANWGMEPQWWWWTRGESYFIEPGVFGVEQDMKISDAVLDAQARFYRAFIIQGALTGATVFSIEPPQDVWEGDSTNPRHFNNVIYPTLRQIIEQKLIASKDDVFAQAKVAYQMRECRTLHEFDQMLQDLDLEVASGFLERAAYGVRFPHLMKELIPDTGGRYYFIPLLPVGTPGHVLARFDKVIQPGECSSVEAYRDLLNRFFPPTENVLDDSATNRAFVLECGPAITVMQSRENLYERQPFTVELPAWITDIRAVKQADGIRLSWRQDSGAEVYRVWRRIPEAKIYPQWELVHANVESNDYFLSNAQFGTFAVTAKTSTKSRLDGTVNFAEYLLFSAEESPVLEQIVLEPGEIRREKIALTDENLPESQDVWRIYAGVTPGIKEEAAAVLDRFGDLMAAFEAKDLDALMSFYDPDYKDSNGYSTEYVRRAWLWWYQRTVHPYVLAQVRYWDTSQVSKGIIQFTAWNRFRGTIVWDEPFGYHGRVRIPRHQNERVTWTWKRNPSGQWLLLCTEPALPNFGEMLWIGRGHDVRHTMENFADTPRSRGQTLR